jgi:3-deoxy-manno-octulosonate cytidylyltransferase (CMP-KDO synthetase)
MTDNSDTKAIVIIPARMASTRLPGKPLADINGVPMIVHVMRRAEEAGVGPVVVACSEPEVADVVRRAGGEAIMTDPDHPSGSDRIWEALKSYDPAATYDVVVNVQGDLPTIEANAVRAAIKPLSDPGVDIATLVAEITIPEERTDPNVVKAAVAFDENSTVGQAIYFSRSPVPSGDGPLYHHIGLYAYRRDALARFVALPPGQLETRERLEQLRALENGMRIDAALVDTVPFGVDTPADLTRAAEMLNQNQG